jgi:hypothetical protein
MAKRTINDIQLDLINITPSPENTRGLFDLVNDAIDSIVPHPENLGVIHTLREHHFFIAQSLMANYNELHFEDVRQSVLSKVHKLS